MSTLPVTGNNSGKKRKGSINPLFEQQQNYKQIHSPANSERSQKFEVLGEEFNDISSPNNYNFSELDNDFSNDNNIITIIEGIEGEEGGGLITELPVELELDTKVTKNVNSNFNISTSLPFSSSTSTSIINTSNLTSTLYSPLNSLSLHSPIVIPSINSNTTSSYPFSETATTFSNNNITTNKMMDQLHSPYLHQDIYPLSSTNNNNNNNATNSPFLTHSSSTPTSPIGLNYQQSQQQSTSSMGLNLNQLHSPHPHSLTHSHSGGSSYYSPDLTSSSPNGHQQQQQSHTAQETGFLAQLAQLSNGTGNVGSGLSTSAGGIGGGEGLSPFGPNGGGGGGMMDVSGGMLSPGLSPGIGMGGGEMKGKGRETLDVNGQIVREVATRRGDDLGIGLGDFDMLDTLGTGTFGKVLLARLHPPSNPFSIRSQSVQPQYYAVKVLEKLTVVRLRQVEHLNSERSTLAHVSHPFIVNLLCTFQDERNLYLLLEYVQGGELFSHLRRAGRFSSDVARFYAANLILALEYLHSQDIIYRDLKPENLLIDGSGYIKITDFGFAKHVTDRTYTLCGTPEYLAPEIITATGHGKAADFWAFGVLLFELLAGYPPFFADNPLEIYEKILTGKFGFPPHIDYVAKDLIKRLLTADLSMRLGNLKNGAMDVKNHRWFEGVDWSAVERKEIRAPIIPQTSTPGDTSNFERYPASPLEDLPGPLRAHRARQYHISPDSLERGQDPYGYLFPCF